MNDLESKIAAWRARFAAALPQQEETVRELEAHLRDHIEVQVKRGVSADEAFAQGVARIGEPRALAREFQQTEKVGIFVRPVVVVYGLVGSGYATIVGVMLWQLYHSRGQDYSLLVTHVLALAGGYLAMVAAGLLGLWTITSGWLRPSPASELQTQRREIFRMTVVASVLVPIGMVLGMVWAARHRPAGAWAWEPLEIGALCILISSWLLLAVQLRRLRDERVRAILALLGAVVAGAGWFAKAWTSMIPMTWLCVAAIFAQGGIALLHERAKRRQTETDRLARS